MNPTPTGGNHFSESITFRADGLEDIQRLLQQAGESAKDFHGSQQHIADLFRSPAWADQVRRLERIHSMQRTMEAFERQRSQGGSLSAVVAPGVVQGRLPASTASLPIATQAPVSRFQATHNKIAFEQKEAELASRLERVRHPQHDTEDAVLRTAKSLDRLAETLDRKEQEMRKGMRPPSPAAEPSRELGHDGGRFDDLLRRLARQAQAELKTAEPEHTKIEKEPPRARSTSPDAYSPAAQPEMKPLPVVDKMPQATYGLADDGYSSRQRREQEQGERAKALKPQHDLMRRAESVENIRRAVQQYQAIQDRGRYKDRDPNAPQPARTKTDGALDKTAQALERFAATLARKSRDLDTFMRGTPVARSLANQRMQEMQSRWADEDRIRKARGQSMTGTQKLQQWWSGEDQFQRAERKRQEAEDRRQLGFYGRNQGVIHGAGNLALGVGAGAFGMGMAGMRDTVVMNRFQNEMERFQRELGQVFAPAVEKAGELMQGAGDWVQRRSPMEKNALMVAGLGATGYMGVRALGMQGLVHDGAKKAGSLASRAGGPIAKGIRWVGGGSMSHGLGLIGAPLALTSLAYSAESEAADQIDRDYQQSRGRFDAAARERQAELFNKYSSMDKEDRVKAAKVDEQKYVKEFADLDKEYSGFGRWLGEHNTFGLGYLNSYGRRKEDLHEKMRVAEQTRVGAVKEQEQESKMALAGGGFEDFMGSYRRIESAFSKIAPTVDQNAKPGNGAAMELADAAAKIGDMQPAPAKEAEGAGAMHAVAEALKELAKQMEQDREAEGRRAGNPPMERNING